MENIIENIIKALRACSDKTIDCKECPYCEHLNCTDHIRQTAADFLQDLVEKNKDLQEEAERDEDVRAELLKMEEELRVLKEDYDLVCVEFTSANRRANRLQGERDAYREIIFRLCGEPQPLEAEDE